MAKDTQQASAAAGNEAPKPEIKVVLSEEELSEESDYESGEEIEGLSEDEQEQLKTKHSVQFAAKKEVKKSSGKKSGVIYIGRIPHGFYEMELKKYFTQFGDIEQVRVARNKKTGKSKHFGYVKFKDQEAARVAAETMHNYLLFGHLLQVSVVEDPKKNLFFGTRDTRQKFTPANEISMKNYNRSRSQAEWDEVQHNFETKKQEKLDKLKASGIDYSL